MIPALLYGDAKTGTYELRHLFIPFFGLGTVPAVFAYASLGCGLAFGLALDVRPGAFPILALFFAAAALLSFAIPDREGVAAGSRGPVMSILLKGIGVFAVAWAVMVLPWLWAHENPPHGTSKRREGGYYRLTAAASSTAAFNSFNLGEQLFLQSRLGLIPGFVVADSLVGLIVNTFCRPPAASAPTRASGGAAARSGGKPQRPRGRR